MSGLEELIAAAKTDRDVRVRVRSAVIGALVDAGKAEGYEFTADDVAAAGQKYNVSMETVFSA